MPRVPRAFRVAEKVREIVAMELLQSGDPRLTLISITSASISKDLREANIYWTSLGMAGSEGREKAAEALREGQGRIKSAVAKKLGIYCTPNLRFFYDDTLDVTDQVDALLKKVAAKDSQISGKKD